MLENDQVKGKPILLLCNKSDIDVAKVSMIRTISVTSFKLSISLMVPKLL